MSCSCGCDDNITALQGAQGDDGTSTTVVSSPISTVAAYHRISTVSRLNTSSDDIRNGGAGYSTALVTVPTVAASNVMIIDINAQITATDIHDVTIQVLVGGVPVANTAGQQNCGTLERVNYRIEIGNVTSGAVYTVNFLSSSGAVTARLTGAHFKVDIYA